RPHRPAHPRHPARHAIESLAAAGRTRERATMMNLSAPFIARPVATTLLTAGILLAGLLGFTGLPVSPLPKIEFPTIQVQASLPGASPDTVSTSLTTPLERRLGAIAGVSELTSSSTVGNSRITL